MDSEVLALASMIYGEVGSTDHDTMVRVGSTALNRLDSGRAEEFGGSLPEVLYRGYYAVSNPNEPMKWAMEGKFPNKDEETRFKKSMQIAYGLKAGTIKREEGMFYFKPSEEKKLRKNKKAFNFDLVKKVNSDDNYNYYSY